MQTQPGTQPMTPDPVAVLEAFNVLTHLVHRPIGRKIPNEIVVFSKKTRRDQTKNHRERNRVPVQPSREQLPFERRIRASHVTAKRGSKIF